MGPKPLEPSIRFWRAVDKTGSCWIWNGGDLNSQGYGRFWLKCPPHRVRIFAHRYSWEIVNGAIPVGLFICHKCDTPLCVNPRHLFLGTHLQNMADAVSKLRMASGERRPQSKLTEMQILSIRALKGTATHREIASRFNVGRECVTKILNNWRWKHLP